MSKQLILKIRWWWAKRHFNEKCKCYSCHFCDYISIDEYGVKFDELGCYHDPGMPFLKLYKKGCQYYKKEVD